ncbi:DUF29 domain-containing protein [Thermosynechococcaceae cyanobacterium BACA0444]|uniref:DUF29 domain-containing protein n=1 Tax=Pseudocalidococcus azoricus BACA0444 TaxID=2918990 RepID=A0AAE4JWE9_9CYAN|nr:DUF29 domain-containing protein [Pseudocalidococcus azoricus]MDS3860981.1 DUF29 domain-containing protein [Pseudocalidococcus azoricus BACA0444]
MSQTQAPLSLYDQDILLWSEDTAAKLRAKDFEHLDLEHLIEEVEALGISQKKELLSRLTVLLEHLLKRCYVNLPENFNGWEITIRHQRTELEILLGFAPSLKSRCPESFNQAWRIALKNVRQGYPQVNFPNEWPFNRSVESLLNNDVWLNENTEK